MSESLTLVSIGVQSKRVVSLGGWYGAERIPIVLVYEEGVSEGDGDPDPR